MVVVVMVVVAADGESTSDLSCSDEAEQALEAHSAGYAQQAVLVEFETLPVTGKHRKVDRFYDTKKAARISILQARRSRQIL